MSLFVCVASPEKARMESYPAYAQWPTTPVPAAHTPGQPCRKGTISSIVRIAQDVGSRRHARTGGLRKMNCKPYGDARGSVVSDVYANNPETKRRALSDCEQVFEDMGSGGFLEPAGAESPEGRPPAGRRREGSGAGPPGPVAEQGAGTAGLAARERHRNRQPQGVRRPGQRHGTGDAASGHRFRRDGARPFPGAYAGGAGAGKGYRQAPSGSARASAGSVPRKYRACASATASRGAASPR